ncbi:MAG: alpha-glucosidase [Bacilli bacterium]|nr:alpha-glucosidase [Bacilli bacterium]MBN2876085.1 alpha-glucosidase [Bacilli bacterium]
MKKQWFKEEFVYQIYPRSFKDSNNDGIGDIPGIIEKIPYLKELGVGIIWLSPVYKSPMEDFGYDISDYRDIAPEFGTMDDIKRLIKELHKAKIRLVMDLVVNHTSSAHEWFQKSVKKEGKYADYYHWEDKKKKWGSFFGGDAWSYNEERGQYYLHLFAKGQPDLNWDNPDVREEVKDLMRFWLDLGVDGFRCDVINLIAKNNQHPNGPWSPILRGRKYYLNHPNLHKYLHELHRDVLSKYDCFTVGETAFVNPKVADLLTNPLRQELDMVFQFDHMGADNYFIKWFMKKFKPMNLKKPLAKWQNQLNGKGWNSLYLENHDQPRSINRFGSLDYRYESATMLAVMLYFQQGTPYIYQGQEIGMTNAAFETLDKYQDIETHNIYRTGRKMGMSHKRMMNKIKMMSRDNARTPMQWDDNANAGFSTHDPWLSVNDNYKEINVAAEAKKDQSVLHFFQRVIELRKKYPVIVYGKYEDLDFYHKDLYSYRRFTKTEEIIVVCNGTSKEVVYEKNYPDYNMILTNYRDQVDGLLQPYEARVFHKSLGQKKK